MSKIIIVGPAPPFRGGISDFNEAFATSLTKAGHNVEVVSFTLQYPSFLFPGKTQYKKSIKSSIHIFLWIPFFILPTRAIIYK